MALFHAYFDSSGTERDEWIIVTAGVVATEQKWSRFEQRWGAVLAKEGVTQFHMQEFAHAKGEFASWKGDEPRRAAFLAALVREVKRGVNKSFIHGVVLPDYRELDRQYQLTETVGGPYSLSQFGCLYVAYRWLMAKKNPHDRAATFVERGDTGIPGFRRYLKSQHLPEPAFIPKVEPNSGKIWVPLQAADLIAYEFRRLYDRRARDGREPPLESCRGVLQAISRMLPLRTMIYRGPGLGRLCADTVPPRHHPADSNS
jgi:hypothetical protein